MSWGYTSRGGLPPEEIEHADFANALDRAMSLPGSYVLGLQNGQVMRFSAAHFLDGGAVHVDEVVFEGPPGISLPGGVDLQIECIAWIGETAARAPAAATTPTAAESARRGVVQA